MRIKIKNPQLFYLHTSMLFLGILSLLALAGIGTAVYFAGGPLKAWNLGGEIIHDMCRDDFTCNACFVLLFKIGPFFIIGVFLVSIWEKFTKFRVPLPGTYFTYITFGTDGVLLEKPDPAQNVFLPYKQTALDVTIKVIQTTSQRLPVTTVPEVVLAFSQPDNTPQTIQLVPPRKIIPFLCNILDGRKQYARFSYKTQPVSYVHQEAADTLQKKLDNYCKKGYLPAFNSLFGRIVALIIGTQCVLFGTILGGFLLLNLHITQDNLPTLVYCCGAFLLLIPFGLWLVISAVKDLRQTRKSRYKQ